MRLNYTTLLTRISQKQGLGIPWNELPLIINTDTTTYTMVSITYEDEDYICISMPNEDGAEFAKMLNKATIISIEIIYQQMLETPLPFKEDGMYG